MWHDNEVCVKVQWRQLISPIPGWNWNKTFRYHIDVLVQERRNSSAIAMELRLSCTNPSIYGTERSPFLGEASRWRHDERDGVSNHRRLNWLLKRLFRRRSKKTAKLRVTGLCKGNSPVTGDFSAQRAGNAEKSFHLMTSSWKIAF